MCEYILEINFFKSVMVSLVVRSAPAQVGVVSSIKAGAGRAWYLRTQL